MDKAPTQLQRLTQSILDFRNARNWAQYHDARNLAMSLSVESSELLELFLWQKGEMKLPDRSALSDELADVFYHVLLLAETCGIDLEVALAEKLKKNAGKYPE